MNDRLRSLNKEHDRIYVEAWRRREKRIGRMYVTVAVIVWLLIMLSVLCK